MVVVVEQHAPPPHYLPLMPHPPPWQALHARHFTSGTGQLQMILQVNHDTRLLRFQLPGHREYSVPVSSCLAVEVMRHGQLYRRSLPPPPPPCSLISEKAEGNRYKKYPSACHADELPCTASFRVKFPTHRGFGRIHSLSCSPLPPSPCPAGTTRR